MAKRHTSEDWDNAMDLIDQEIARGTHNPFAVVAYRTGIPAEKLESAHDRRYMAYAASFGYDN